MDVKNLKLYLIIDLICSNKTSWIIFVKIEWVFQDFVVNETASTDHSPKFEPDKSGREKGKWLRFKLITILEDKMSLIKVLRLKTQRCMYEIEEEDQNYLYRLNSIGMSSVYLKCRRNECRRTVILKPIDKLRLDKI